MSPAKLPIVAVLAAVAACHSMQPSEPHSPAPAAEQSAVGERNKATFKKLFDDVINTGHLELANQYLTVDRPDHQNLGFPAEMAKGYGGFQTVVGMFRAAFPDLTFTSEYMIAEGDLVLSYNVIEGTQKGPFLGVPASGKRIHVNSADICRFGPDGKITEHWGITDMVALMIQIGAMPPPGAPPAH